NIFPYPLELYWHARNYPRPPLATFNLNIHNKTRRRNFTLYVLPIKFNIHRSHFFAFLYSYKSIWRRAHYIVKVFRLPVLHLRLLLLLLTCTLGSILIVVQITEYIRSFHQAAEDVK
ncbi:hypothetical protein ACJX0J_007843, partial [Zea mays]